MSRIIDPTCGAFWTHCVHECITGCDHNEDCVHPYGHHTNTPQTCVIPPEVGGVQ